jgi:hypothetical protein
MLNSNLDDVCAIVGYTATRKLAAWFHGRNLYVPSNPRPDHPVERLIGESAFRQLVKEFGGKQIWVPTPAEDHRYFVERVMSEQMAQGMTDEQLVEAHGLTPERVRQLRAELVDKGWVRYAGTISPPKPMAGRNAGLEKRFQENF